MIKQISVDRLRSGMYIHDLDCGWMAHPFFRNQFLLDGDADIARILDAGIRRVYIDTERGLDDREAPSAEAVDEALTRELAKVAAAAAPAAQKVSLREELDRARQIKDQAHQAVRGIMQDARLGRAIALEQAEPVVEQVTGSILRNPGALVSLLRIKNKDDYTFLHSVSVCALMVAFCRHSGANAETTRQAGLGGLMHDIGKMKTPDEVLNKPGRLTDAEFDLIKRHPADGHAILQQTPGIGPIPLEITLQHQERRDGSGYPGKLAGDGIGLMGRMAAIADVYDAITSDRCYHKGMPATDALRKLYEWSQFHFDPDLVQAFVRCIGIYPAGTLVELESGRLGVVAEHNEGNLLQPVVRVFYDTRRRQYLPPADVDLAKPLGSGGADRIAGHGAPEKWGVDPARFL